MTSYDLNVPRIFCALDDYY